MIKVENLSYAYKKNNKVLENISFEIQDGEIVLLLGINGVGKTTLLECISGLLPTKHCITFDGEEVWDYAELAFISEESIAFPHWKVERYGAFLQSQYAKFSIERFWNLLEFFSIDKNKKIHTLSKGQKMKLEVAAGFAKNTKYIIMDEPFSGNDIFTRENLMEKLIEQLAGTQTILMSTHELTEVENFVDRVIVLKDGTMTNEVGLKNDCFVDEIREMGMSMREYFAKIYGK